MSVEKNRMSKSSWELTLADFATLRITQYARCYTWLTKPTSKLIPPPSPPFSQETVTSPRQRGPFKLDLQAFRILAGTVKSKMLSFSQEVHVYMDMDIILY